MAASDDDITRTTSKSLSDLTTAIASRLNDVRRRMDAAARRAGRDPAEIRLIGVSKTWGLDSVRAAGAAGLTDFGENRVQEALEKIDQTTDMKIAWHLIGHLQSNKVRRAAGSFAWIHSIDDVELLRRIDLAAADQNASPSVLVQVDLAGETTKHGAPITGVPRIFDAGLACRAARIEGLMVLPPWSTDPETARPYFRRLAELRGSLRAQGVDHRMLRHLSMGMSHDFEVAIEEGATMVRVGTAIFGRRTPRIDP
jgi:pyridoxal phosphate enzyme (YggS family)